MRINESKVATSSVAVLYSAAAPIQAPSSSPTDKDYSEGDLSGSLPDPLKRCFTKTENESGAAVMRLSTWCNMTN